MTWGTLDYARLDASRHAIAVRYTFTVNGVRYVGNRLSLINYGGKEFALEDKAQDLKQEQSTNGRTAVYYDPRNPSNNCLEVGTTGSIATFAWSVVAFLLGVSCIHQGLWPKR